jgi:hypothetical protein
MQSLEVAYINTFLATLVTIVTLLLSKNHSAQRLAWGYSFLSYSCLLVMLSLKTGHIPVFGESFEVYIFAAWMLAVIAYLHSLKSKHKAKSYVVAGSMLFLLFSTLHTGVVLQPYAFWYTHWLVIGFFLFRVITLAIIFYSGCLYMTALLETKHHKQKKFTHMGRNYLLMGTITFCISELSGCIWAYIGWGEFWRFNAAFYTSAGAFLLLMIPMHLSGKWTSQKWIKPTIGATVAICFQTYVMIRMH